MPSSEPLVVTWPERTLRALDRAVAAGGTVMLLGGTDSGKSTLACELVNRGLAAGRRVGVVDADVGQTEVGPPTAIGFGVAAHPIQALSDIAPRGLYFVGDTTPERHLLPAVVGTALLVRAARAQRCDLIIVDTTGMIAGPAAHVLKFYKIQAVRPRSLVALQAGRELEVLLAPFSGRGAPCIHRLSVAPGVQVKSVALRSERRRRAFAAYFSQARELALDRSAVALWPAVSPARLHLLRDRMCGLLDGRGATLAVGTIREASPYLLTVTTPLLDATQIATVQIGSLRVTPGGDELGRADMDL